MGFEDSMKKLETIVKKLEEGDMPIEDSIAEFEKGIHLLQDCRKLLDKAQKQVETLVGEMSDEKETD